MGEENLETWIGKMSGYKEINGIIIPANIEAIYRLKEGDYSYARFNENINHSNLNHYFAFMFN